MALNPTWDTARPLVSPGRARRLVRLILLAAAAMAGAWWLLSRDPASGLALSPRGWATLGLVAAMIVVLVREHDRRRVARDVLVVAVVVALMLPWSHSPTPTKAQAAQAAKRATAQAAGFGDGCPEVAKIRAWVECLWRQSQANQKGGRS